MTTTTRARPTGLDPDLAAALDRATRRWALTADALPDMGPRRRQRVLLEVAAEAETLLAAILRANHGPRLDDDTQRLRTAVRRLHHVATAGELHPALPCRVLSQAAVTIRRDLRPAGR